MSGKGMVLNPVTQSHMEDALFALRKYVEWAPKAKIDTQRYRGEGHCPGQLDGIFVKDVLVIDNSGDVFQLNALTISIIKGVAMQIANDLPVYKRVADRDVVNLDLVKARLDRICQRIEIRARSNKVETLC